MKREDFKKIIKLRSFWKIDRRKGNYKLPDGSWLSEYVAKLIEQGVTLDAKLVGDEAAKGDEVSREIVMDVARYLGVGMINLIQIFLSCRISQEFRRKILVTNSVLHFTVRQRICHVIHCNPKIGVNVH